MKSLLSSLVTLCICSCLSAHSNESAAIQSLTDKANALIVSLDTGQKAILMMEMDSPERVDWHYIPKNRKGLSLREMNPDQRARSMDFLSELMSRAGMEKVEGVIASETILWHGSNKSEHRNPEKYHFSIFGNPGNHSTWGASVEGHHLSINLTIIDGHEVLVTPSFMGSNPDKSDSGHQPLASEMDKAKALFASLDANQQKVATLAGETPREILTSSSQKVSAFEKSGLPAAKMNAAQEVLLRQLMMEYINRYRESLAEDDWNKIEQAGFDKVTFLWSSTPEPKKALYYRIQGPTFVIEYANAQNHGNHSHTVWRDFENDFGYDALGAHMRDGH